MNIPSRWSDWVELFYRPVSGASVVVFRIAFGALMMWEVWRYYSKGWIERYYITPDFHFTYWGFEWVQPWPGIGMHIHFYVMGVFALFMMIGLFYRLSALGFFLTFTYIFLLEQARYLNHFYLISLIAFIMILVPAHRYFSVDAWIFPRKKNAFVPSWSLWILQFLVGVPYFYGGIAKLNHDWLRGEPLSSWIYDSVDFPVIGQYFQEAWMGLFLSYSGLILDLLFVPLLLWKRTRVLGYIFVLAFNLTNAQLFSIGVFPWFMIAGSTIFFEPDWPETLLRKIGCTFSRSQHHPQSFGSLFMKQCTTAFILMFVLFQSIFPFRHLLYPGVVHWTEEGHRWAWHMKLRSKDAKGYFVVRDPVSKRVWEVDPDDHLTTRQERKMMTRPYLILYFAHYLDDLFRDNGYEDVEVYAHIHARLNDRKMQPFTDSTVDLSKEKHTLGSRHWIVPLEEF